MNERKLRALGDFLRVKHGYAFKGEFFADSGDHVLLTPGNFSLEGGLKLKGDKEKYYTGPIPPEFVLERGDLIVAMTDLIQNAPILGAPAFIPESGRFLHNQRLGKIVRLKADELDKRYLYFAMETEDFRAQVRATATGATVRHTAPERIYAAKIPVPPLQIQKKVAATLAAYEELIENNTRRIAILEEMSRALYREWFIDFRFPGHELIGFSSTTLGEIPRGWQVKRLGDILELRYGKALKKEQRRGGDVPVFGSSGVVGYHDESLAEGPGLIVGRKGNVGSLFWSEQSFFVIDTAYFVSSSLPLRFLFFDLQNKKFINSDAAVPGLSRHQAYSLETVVPPSDLLQRFVELVDRFEAGAYTLRRTVQNLRATRDLLLPTLISGELDVSHLPDPGPSVG